MQVHRQFDSKNPSFEFFPFELKEIRKLASNRIGLFQNSLCFLIRNLPSLVVNYVSVVLIKVCNKYRGKSLYIVIYTRNSKEVKNKAVNF